MTMPLYVTWQDLALRLVCSLIAGAVIGYNRGEHGEAAGLRTTLLVCLAAAVAMLQVNYLLPLAGRQSDSFVMNDLMRLPLGILTGVGFIGAGAILRRRELVIGVTTAATLWYVTVIGLCFGGGQILLGWVATAIGCFVLWGMKWLEGFMVMEHYARLILTIDDEVGPSEGEIRNYLSDSAIEILEVNLAISGHSRVYTLNVRDIGRQSGGAVPPAVAELSRHSGVRAVTWRHFG
jgi:putative Mg2+ transporter-C (MgtC) family protein